MIQLTRCVMLSAMTSLEVPTRPGRRLRLVLAVAAILLLATAGASLWWLDDSGQEHLVPGPASTAHR